MTKLEMQAKLEREDLNGVGVKVTVGVAVGSKVGVGRAFTVTSQNFSTSPTFTQILVFPGPTA